jgi:hypothetical protein
MNPQLTVRGRLLEPDTPPEPPKTPGHNLNPIFERDRVTLQPAHLTASSHTKPAGPPTATPTVHAPNDANPTLGDHAE